jgi:hypothetical protein
MHIKNILPSEEQKEGEERDGKGKRMILRYRPSRSRGQGEKKMPRGQ